MILAFYGVPRSGKSCGAVKYIVDAAGLSPDEFYNAAKFGGRDYLSDRLLKHGKYREIYHNIEGLDCFNDITGSETKCILHNWDAEPSYRRLLVLDECHRFLDKPSSDVINFFAYHGHYGFDIILITQSPFLIPRKLTVLAEIEYTAVRRSFRFRDELRYSVGAAGEKTDVYVIKDPSKYFRLYKSAAVHSKPKRQVIKFVAVFSVLALFAVGSIGFMVYRFSGRKDAKKNEKKIERIEEPLKEAPSSRVRAGAKEPDGKPGYSWQAASTITYTDGINERSYVVVGGVLEPIGKYIKAGQAVRVGRTYRIYLPEPEPEKENENGIGNNTSDSWRSDL